MQLPKDHEEARAVALLSHFIMSPSFHPPMLPDVARKAMQLASTPNADIRNIARLIERDQLLAVRFLRTANSGLYRRGLPALSVQAALTRIGLATARDVLVFASLEPLLFTSHQFADEMNRLRKHSLAVSAACTYLASGSRTPADDAGLAGLVHDIGAAVLIKFMSDNVTMFAGLLASGAGINGVLKITHTAAGARLADLWQLPALMKAVMKGHHEASSTSPEIVRLVAAADELATLAGAGSGFEPLDRSRLSIKNFVHPPARVDDSVRRFSERVSELSSI
ncbi:MAG: HDOD domain-containing protein [Deltaproteobacteria bacterium]|nr:HDOD domain-containing protein [Deltaproteobacteria bacterium]